MFIDGMLHFHVILKYRVFNELEFRATSQGWLVPCNNFRNTSLQQMACAETHNETTEMKRLTTVNSQLLPKCYSG